MITPAIGTLAERILAPFAGRPDGAWQQAPAGKWSPGQIVHHLAISIDTSANGFASRLDKPPMVRRRPTVRQWLFRKVLFATGSFGPPRKAPATTLPQQAPDRAATEALLRGGAARFAALADRILPGRARDLFLKHPVLGDLTYEEWCVFHERHAAHHLRQIRERLGQR